jgi:hypothetical protein
MGETARILVLFALAASLIFVSGCVFPPFGEPPSQNATVNETKNNSIPALNRELSPEAKELLKPVVDTSEYPDGNVNQKVIKSVLASYKHGYAESFYSVSKIGALGPEALSDILPLLKDENIYAEWSGLSALSVIIPQASGEQKAQIKSALLPLLESERVSIRGMAAYELLALGEKKGIPVLIGLMNETDLLLVSEPPHEVCDMANTALVTYTEKDFGFMCGYGEFDALALGKWEQWWSQYKEEISFDPEKKKFVSG